MTQTLSMRFIEKDDVDEALDVERRAHEYVDPDFGVPQLAPYAWGPDDLMEVVRRYKSKSKATDDTRVYVAEVLTERLQEDGLVTREAEVVGCLAYELQEDGYEVLLMSALEDAARRAMLEMLLGKMSRSDTRKKLSTYVPDGDWKTLKFLMNNDLTGDARGGKGFSVRLVPNPSPGGFDCWYAEYRLPAETQKDAQPSSA